MSSTFDKLIVAVDKKVAVDGSSASQYLVDITKYSGLGNLVTNGDFELWTAGPALAPDGWVLTSGVVAREGSNIKISAYSAKLTRTGGVDAVLSQSIHLTRGINYWKGQTITFSCYVNYIGGSIAALAIKDGVTETQVYHSGASGYAFVYVTHTVSATATQLTLELRVLNANAIVYFDGAMAVDGYLPFTYTPLSAGGGGPSTDTLDDVCDRGATTDQTIVAGGFTTTGAAALGATGVTALTVNSAFSLPTADGTANQQLKTDGAGNLTWFTPSASGSYYTTFTNANLVAGVLTVNHALNASGLHVTIYRETGNVVFPTTVHKVDNNNVTVDLTPWAPITGTWEARVSV